MTRRVIAVLVAVVLAAIGVGAVLLYLRSADARAIEGKQALTVLVANKAIPAGTTGRALVDDDYVREVRMPAETVPQEALQKMEPVLEAQVVTAAVRPGQLLLRPMFGTAVAGTSGLVVPADKILGAVKVEGNAFGPGAVQAGSRVVLFYTYTPAPDERGVVAGGFQPSDLDSRTRVLMTDIEVVSVSGGQPTDGETSAPGSAVRGAAGRAADVTMVFALTQREAETLAHAKALGGQFNVGLLGDSSNIDQADPGVDNRSLFRN